MTIPSKNLSWRTSESALKSAPLRPSPLDVDDQGGVVSDLYQSLTPAPELPRVRNLYPQQTRATQSPALISPMTLEVQCFPAEKSPPSLRVIDPGSEFTHPDINAEFWFTPAESKIEGPNARWGLHQQRVWTMLNPS